jgi:hypothetical protein
MTFYFEEAGPEPSPSQIVEIISFLNAKLVEKSLPLNTHADAISFVNVESPGKTEEERRKKYRGMHVESLYR